MASTARTTRNRQRRANRREPRLFPDFQPVSCRPVCRLPGAVCDTDSAEWWCGDPFCFSVAEIRSLKWWSCLTSRSLVVDLPLKRGTRLDPFCTPRKKRPGLSRRQSLTAAERLGMLLSVFRCDGFIPPTTTFSIIKSLCPAASQSRPPPPFLGLAHRDGKCRVPESPYQQSRFEAKCRSSRPSPLTASPRLNLHP